MTIKEAERLRLMKNHSDGIVSLKEIAELLELSYRQTKRIWKNFKIHDASGLISKKRKMRNRALQPKVEKTVLE